MVCSIDFISSSSIHKSSNHSHLTIVLSLQHSSIELTGVDGSKVITTTELGNMMAKLQVDPALCRLLYFGCLTGAGVAAAHICGLMSVASNVFFRRPNASEEEKDQTTERHRAFFKKEGDVVTLFRLFEKYNAVLEGVSVSLDEEGGGYSSIEEVDLSLETFGDEELEIKLASQMETNKQVDGMEGSMMDSFSLSSELDQDDGDDDDLLSVLTEDFSVLSQGEGTAHSMMILSCPLSSVLYSLSSVLYFLSCILYPLSSFLFPLSSVLILLSLYNPSSPHNQGA